MRLRRDHRFHGLKRPRIRQTWNKYNLFIMARACRIQLDVTKTFFQQKWKAKALARGYHGSHVLEGKWERAFSRRLLSVVPMDPKYMASTDGSTEAAGRGSGLKLTKPDEEGKKLRKYWNNPATPPPLFGKGDPSRMYTPYMQMTFAPLERRLDTAIFRALFASSARQARNFVVHGKVKVNGIKMRYPGYLLNPGDMFEVEPESVMYATGWTKGYVAPTSRKDETRAGQVASTNVSDPAAADTAAEAVRGAEISTDSPGADTGSDVVAAGSAVKLTSEVGESTSPDSIQESASGAKQTGNLTPKDQQIKLKALIEDAKVILENKGDLSAKQKRRLRAFRTDAKELLRKSQREAKKEDIPDSQIVSELAVFIGKLNITDIRDGVSEAEKTKKEVEEVISQTEVAAAGLKTGFNKDKELRKAQAREEEKATATAAGEQTEDKPTYGEDLFADRMAQEDLEELLFQEAHNFEDPSKSYHTPWKPRPFMSAFAFIPRYLEVNPNICAAVYLRHPVARPGRAEVPTPFPEWLNSMAFNYYLRRR